MGVLEVPDQTAEGGSTRRVPLGRRVVATLEAARSTLNTDRILDDDLRRIRDGDQHAALRHVEQTSVAAVSSLAAGPNRRVRVSSVQHRRGSAAALVESPGVADQGSRSTSRRRSLPVGCRVPCKGAPRPVGGRECGAPGGLVPANDQQGGRALF
jgi:hypothetical protein